MQVSDNACMCLCENLNDLVSMYMSMCIVYVGASLITIHGRYRVNLVGRTGAGARDGPAHLDQIAQVKAALPNIPIISNGNIITWTDVVSNLQETGCDGVMSAEGLLDNPALFAPASLSSLSSVAASVTVPAAAVTKSDNGSGADTDDVDDVWGDASLTDVSNLQLAVEYLDLVECCLSVDKAPTKLKSVVFHIRR